ncbi:MAG: class F sortase [Chloroflexota bacterium]|jgi:sortase A
MGRVLSIVICFSILLVGAGYPVAVSLGAVPSILNGGERSQSTATPTTAAPTATSVRKPSIEETDAILSKLKPLSSQGTSAKKEVPIELPKRILIPSIDVDAGFEFVGMAADGAMDVPKDPQKVAWYCLGPKPGELGNAILAGHVDWGGSTGVFWRLYSLNPGEMVEIVAVDNKRYQFIVQWQKWYDADKAPVEQVFAQRGVSELTMITCGGVFDQKTKQYLSRLVVRAIGR